ncbi:PilZ domain-containing protein [Microvirga sp. ACRRW]|uniref:PilZ domain-containing protein n=1 Tax=Microvirga sp. ACRRW TaxID=2918205 RepID=UPI001EF44FAC|nr:PilZ domain-containing protein [Microvirga sp. ACRRW]MCG7393105.1 PilZ domain-containing protein [Microvirga sp. ACRRW]
MNPVEQRRASPRTRTLLEGLIVYNNRLSRMECTVRDLSETGACLVFSQPVKVPREFELQIPKRKLTRRAQIMWYDGRHHGVMFLDADEGLVATNKTVPLVPASEGASVPEILDEARLRIAQVLGVSADVIQLKVEIDK